MDIRETRSEFYRKIIIIGIPVVIQNLIGMGINLIDTLMIGKLGENELAAVGAANQLYFIFTVALFGLFSGAAVYTAQFWGQGDVLGVKKTLGIDYVIAIFLAFIFSMIAVFIPDKVIGIFTNDLEVIEIGKSYLKIVVFSYILTALSFAISYNSRAIQRLMGNTVINAVALVINAFLNYVLIFGKFGAPALGVRGAAIATLIARAFEFIALICIVYFGKDHPLRANFKELTAFNYDLFKRVMKTAVPVLFSESSWAISVALIFAAYGRLGTASLAVAQVSNVVSELLQSIFFGIGNATMVFIGENLGRGEKEKAYYLSTLALKVIVVVSTVVALVFIVTSKAIAGAYDFVPATISLLVDTLRVQGILIIPKMIAYIYIIGILRAGGDTFFTLIIELFSNIFVQIPMAYFAVLVLGVSLPIAMLLVGIGELIKIIACIPRVRSRKWLNTVT